MSKTCVINFANNRAWYMKGQVRLKQSFLAHGYDGDFLLANDEKDWGSPPHTTMPYAFKSYGIQKAIKMGYDRIFWCDSAIYLYNENSLSRIKKQLDEFGFAIAINGWSTGQWCSDAALPLLGITREESFAIPHPMANVMCFDLHNKTTLEFLKRYHVHAQDGSFRGSWKNKNHEVSKDPRVLGHRHDQTAAGVIAWRLGMKFLINWTSYDPKNTRPEIVFLTHPA